MARNMRMTRNANVVVTVPVAAGTLAGAILPIGADGLMGFALTDRFAVIDPTLQTTYPQGMQVGEASVELLGIPLVVSLPVGVGLVALGDPVYRVAADGTYSNAAAGGVLIGWALTATTVIGQNANVALRASV